MSKTIDWWKELEMKLKVIGLLIATFASLGVGTTVKSGWAFLEDLQKTDVQLKAKDKKQDLNIEKLAEFQLEKYYELKHEELKDNRDDLQDQLRQIRMECGGIGDGFLPKCGQVTKEDYRAIEGKKDEAIKVFDQLKNDKAEFEKKQIQLKEEE